MQDQINNKYSKVYSEKSFWVKIRNYAKIAGQKVTEPALIMYYCLKDKDTPLRIKLIIITALGYFILPTDVIPDITPLVGFTDDLGALLTAYELVRLHTKPEHLDKAGEKVRIWFAPESA